MPVSSVTDLECFSFNANWFSKLNSACLLRLISFVNACNRRGISMSWKKCFRAKNCRLKTCIRRSSNFSFDFIASKCLKLPIITTNGNLRIAIRFFLSICLLGCEKKLSLKVMAKVVSFESFKKAFFTLQQIVNCYPIWCLQMKFFLRRKWIYFP